MSSPAADPIRSALSIAPASAPLYDPLVERALRRAAIAHAGQTRKATELPYLVHPLAVALILVRAEFSDPVVLAAALLHDVVEDTPVTLDELRREFPAAVVEIVDVLTEQKLDAAGQKRPWRVRKSEQRERVSRASVETRAICLADRRHNLEAIRHDLEAGAQVWERFNAGRNDVLAGYRLSIDCTAYGDPRLLRLGAECRMLVAQLQAAEK